MDSNEQKLIDAGCSCDLSVGWVCGFHKEFMEYKKAAQAHTDALVAAAVEECAKWLDSKIEANTQQEDESFPDAAGGPRQYMKKGEWLASLLELQILNGLREHIRSLAPPDAAAALERVKAEAERRGRLEEASWWNVDRLQGDYDERIAELEAQAKGTN